MRMHKRNRDSESGSTDDDFFGLEDPKIRNGFIRKVYGILATQFAFTIVVVSIMYTRPVQNYLLENGLWLMWVAFAGFFVVFLVLICAENLRRTVPINFILLILLTFFMSIVVGYQCLVRDLDAVFFAAGLCLLVCVTVSLFSCWTSFDFTKLVWIMFIVVFVFVISGFLMIFFPSKIGIIIYSAIGVGIFVVYLAIDTQMIIGGKRLQISTEEYILAAIHLYLDIVYIFLYLLQIISQSR